VATAFYFTPLRLIMTFMPEKRWLRPAPTKLLSDMDASHKVAQALEQCVSVVCCCVAAQCPAAACPQLVKADTASAAQPLVTH
jgi:hypothetical protein